MKHFVIKGKHECLLVLLRLTLFGCVYQNVAI